MNISISCFYVYPFQRGHHSLLSFQQLPAKVRRLQLFDTPHKTPNSLQIFGINEANPFADGSDKDGAAWYA